MTRAQFEDLRRRVERSAPTRAQGVLTLIASVETPEIPNRRQRREEARRKQHRHPGRKTARERRREWHDPSPEEQNVREVNRLVRKHQRSSPEEDGDVAGLLRAVAEFALPTLLKDFALEQEEAAPLTHWLMWKFGQVLHDPDIAGYLRWREESRAKAIEKL